MSKAASVQPYRWLAEHFDRVFGEYRKSSEAAHRAIVEPILPQVRVACDLACGNGTTALDLAARGIPMYGVDLSPGMCRATRRKARERKLALRVIQADMRNFRLPERMDLILSEYDAIIHVPRRSDFRRVASTVARTQSRRMVLLRRQQSGGIRPVLAGQLVDREARNRSRHEKRP